MMIDQERIEGALEVVSASIAGHHGHPVRWGLAWRDAMRKLNKRAVLKSCREVSFEGTDREKRKARHCARLVRRGIEYAKQVEEIERAMGSLYPADEAKRRLDHELGWEIQDGDSDARALDRAMMKSRAMNPNSTMVRIKAHEIVRGRFGELEVADAT